MNKQTSSVKSKKSLVVVLILVLLLIVGFFTYNKVKSDKYGTSNNNTSGGVFTSVKDALTKKMTIACEFKDEKGSVVKSYIKNGAVRVTMLGTTNAEQNGEIIMKDKKMYMWNETTKQGFVYDVPDSDTSSNTNNNNSMNNNGVSQSDNYLSMIEEYKDSCKVTTVEDSYFTVPSDVKFQDMSKFLEDLKNQMPSGVPNY